MPEDEGELTNTEEEEGSGARISEREDEGNSTHNPDHRNMEKRRNDLFPDMDNHRPDNRSMEKKRGEIFDE